MLLSVASYRTFQAVWRRGHINPRQGIMRAYYHFPPLFNYPGNISQVIVIIVAYCGCVVMGTGGMVFVITTLHFAVLGICTSVRIGCRLTLRLDSYNILRWCSFSQRSSFTASPTDIASLADETFPTDTTFRGASRSQRFSLVAPLSDLNIVLTS